MCWGSRNKYSTGAEQPNTDLISLEIRYIRPLHSTPLHSSRFTIWFRCSTPANLVEVSRRPRIEYVTTVLLAPVALMVIIIDWLSELLFCLARSIDGWDDHLLCYYISANSTLLHWVSQSVSQSVNVCFLSVRPGFVPDSVLYGHYHVERAWRTDKQTNKH